MLVCMLLTLCVIRELKHTQGLFSSSDESQASLSSLRANYMLASRQTSPTPCSLFPTVCCGFEVWSVGGSKRSGGLWCSATQSNKFRERQEQRSSSRRDVFERSPNLQGLQAYHVVSFVLRPALLRKLTIFSLRGANSIGKMHNGLHLWSDSTMFVFCAQTAAWHISADLELKAMVAVESEIEEVLPPFHELILKAT